MNTELVTSIAEKAAERGGRAYYVGGFVRDRFLGIDNKDIDIEVHGIEPFVLEEILDSGGKRLAFGKSFGIYSIKGTGIDVAMPRRETAIGRGHRDFAIFVDPYLGVEKAAKRRDFTINALMQDVLTGAVIDPFGGLSDLKKGILRHVDECSFAEDPLRVLRAAQFAARFEFRIAEDTVSLCRGIDLSTLSPERILEELKKAILKAKKPSVFFEVLRKMGQLKVWFPEAEALIGVEQNPKFHPEGDVWVHSMKVLDAAVEYRDLVQNQVGFMLSALAHDFGKPRTTETIGGVIHAYRHEVEGLTETEAFMRRLTNEKKLIAYVLNMVEYHMKPNIIANGCASIKSSNKMFDRSVEPAALIYLSMADAMPGAESAETFLFERLKIYEETMAKPYVKGSDLIEAGLSPDENFAELLDYAHKLRLAGIEKKNALKQTLAYKRK